MLALAVVAASGYWLILHPDNPFTRLFQRNISDVDARVVIGPYPSERDFRLLKAHDVGLIVSVLNPAIPYEATLIERERTLAAKYGIELRIFPMSSILGQKFGDDYDTNAAKAAAAIAETNRKVYLHCYLGMHRIKAVRELLASRGVQAGTYAVRKGERNEAAALLDTAEAAYNAGHYQQALDTLARIDEKNLTDNARLLRAWSHYRLGRIQQARDLFEAFSTLNRESAEAAIGLGSGSNVRSSWPRRIRIFATPSRASGGEHHEG
jgi:tetratricopeptide (TPR) repeat protein